MSTCVCVRCVFLFDVFISNLFSHAGRRQKWHTDFHRAMERGHDREAAKALADKLNPDNLKWW